MFPANVGAVGEQSGRLRGRVFEARTQTPFAGGNIEISSDALVGGPRTVRSDSDGRFDFIELPPGKYRLKFSYEGLRPVQRQVSLGLGQSQELEVPVSAELSAEQTLVIVEERHHLDADRLSPGALLSAEQQAKLPTLRSYQDIVHQVAGVVGGANPVMGGGSARQNRYLVDGLDITDPSTNTSAFDFNFDAIAQVDALTVPIDAQYNALGGVINLITAAGSDRFKADASVYFNHQALSAGSLSGTQLYEGRLLDQSDPPPPQARYQVNLNVGGPLVRQRLWFFLSAEYQHRLSAIPPGPPLNSQHAAYSFDGFFPRLKLTAAPARRHQLTLSLQADPKFESNLRQVNTYADAAEYARQRTGVFGVLAYQWFITDRLTFGLQTGVAFTRSQLSPQNGDTVDSAHSDRASGIVSNAANAYRIQDDQRLRLQLDPTLTWVKRGWLGSHTFKGGAQLQVLREYWLFGTPGNLVYFDDSNQSADRGVLTRDPASQALPAACNPLQPYPLPGVSATPCSRIRTYDPAFIQRPGGWGIGGFLQDQWKPTRFLTLLLGVRMDYGTAHNTPGEVVANLLGFGPRAGLTVDLSRDGKTLAKLAYGRANEVSTLLLSSYADIGPQERDWSYNRATGRFDRFFGASFGSTGYDLHGRCPDGSVTYACGNAKLSLAPPYTDSVFVSLEREVFRNLMASVSYTFRYIGNQWKRTELNIQRTLDGGSYAAYGDKTAGSISAYRPSPDAFRRYNGVDFVLAGNPSASWTLYLSYTLSFLEGSFEDVVGTEQLGQICFDPPRDFRLHGYLPDDHRHQLKFQGSYSWRGLSIGWNPLYLSGAPLSRLYLTPIDYLGRYAWRGVDPGERSE